MTSKPKTASQQSVHTRPVSKNMDHGRIVSISDDRRCLDTVQLNRLEQTFRQWAQSSPRRDVRLSRRRILIVFLLIRYTGAKLHEVLSLNPFEDLDTVRHTVIFRNAGTEKDTAPREVYISEALSLEIQATLADPPFRDFLTNRFDVDPGFVRRKFYDRARACGFSKGLGGPEAIRKARAVELMQGNMPLPVVQKILGHATPNLTSSYVSFSADEIQHVTRLYMDREASRKTSARNSFFCKIQHIQRGDIQAMVELITVSGHPVTAVITNDSLDRLGLKAGRLITAEVKAPWVILQQSHEVPACSAENRFKGVVSRITRGQVSTEYSVRLSDGTELCAVVTSTGRRQLHLHEADRVWVLFNCFSVVLHID